MAFTKINAAGIGTTETVTVDGLTVINNGSFGGNLTVSGVLTYEDVTNVDSVGLITARNGIVVGSGITLSKDGDIFATGVTTTGSLVSSGAISGTTGTFTGDVDIADKIIHTGDTDTTIRFPSADTIRFDTGGTEAARINSSQKLIIGDTNSDAQLGVYRASYNLAEFTNTNADATGAEVALRKDSSSPADGDVLGMLKFLGDNDAGEKVNYAYIQSKSSDVSDGTEDGRLEFYTRGAGTLGERLRITSIGDVGVNVTPVTSRGPLHVHRVSSSDVHVHLTNTDTGTTANDGMSVFANDNHGGLWLRENGNMLFATNDTEKLRITASGELLLGATASAIVGGGGASLYQIETTTQNAISCVSHRGTGNASGSILILGKSRGTSAGAVTVVASGDELGALRFAGADGTDLQSRGAEISGQVDGTPGSNDMPGRLVFKTTADGAASPTERLRIDSSGKVAIGNASPQQLLHVWPDTANTTSAYIRVTSGDRGSGTGVELGSDADGDGRLNVVSNAKLKLYTNNTQRFTIDESGNVGFGLGSSYAPETPIDVVANWANTRSDVQTVSSYHRKLPLNERGDITIVARHSASKDGAIGYVGPIIDFRSTNSSNEEWTVAQLVGGTDPLGGTGYQGGLAVFASNGGNNPNPAPSGRRDQGDAPTLSTVIAPYRITTFCSTGNQTSSAIHITKNFAANNVQSDMIHFDVNGAGRGRIMSADSGSNSPSFGAYSDRRLKTNFRNYTGGYDRIKAIPVKLYDEVLNDQTKSIFGDHVKNDVIGWIADEVQSVFPEAVVGTKDQVATADDVTAGISTAIGDPIYQSISEGRFLPDAIQAIQKLIEKVETLETKVAALEG